MSETTQGVVGSVVSLRRYPVKSMMGEELNAVDVTDRGLLGDRAYALLDAARRSSERSGDPADCGPAEPGQCGDLRQRAAGRHGPPRRSRQT